MGTTRRAAFSTWGDRIAPVFDVAPQVLLVEADAARVLRERQEWLSADLPIETALRLADLSVGTLICGAISRALLVTVEAYGIRVRPFLAGDLREVVESWLHGEIDDASDFAMPGCGERCWERLGEPDEKTSQVPDRRGTDHPDEERTTMRKEDRTTPARLAVVGSRTGRCPRGGTRREGNAMGGGRGRGRGGEGEGGRRCGGRFRSGGLRALIRIGDRNLDPEAEKEMLRSRAEALQSELDSVRGRIDELEADAK